MVFLPYLHESGGVRKPLHSIASAHKDLQGLPRPVQSAFGTLLLDVQFGGTPSVAKPLGGFGGTRVMELVDDYDTNTFRAVYTAQFAKAVYVLHVFQKKSTSGIATPLRDITLIHHRFAAAREHYRRHYAEAP